MSKAIDLTGRRFTRLTVLFRLRRHVRLRVRWVCQCDCGRIKTIASDSLLSGKGKSCGCLHAEQSRINLGKNRRVYFEHNGHKFYQNQFLREFGSGVSLDSFRRRVKKGIPPLEAATKPMEPPQGKKKVA